MKTVRLTRKLNRHGSTVPVATKHAQPITQNEIKRDSALRVVEAVRVLHGSERGQCTLRLFKAMMVGGAQGLDMTGQSALISLTREATFGGQTAFLELIGGVA